MQLLDPEKYPDLQLEDQWIEDIYQQFETDWLIEQIGASQNILELGYGSGIIVNALATAGKSVTLVEGASKFCDEASQIAGVKVVHSMFEDFKPTGTYDFVIASHVLEHIEEPMRLMLMTKKWSKRLIAVVGNANSYHRQLAVLMGLQKTIYDLSERDRLVGHYRVYDEKSIDTELRRSGWQPKIWKGFMLKTLHNDALAQMPGAYITALNKVKVPHQKAANIGVIAVSV